MLDLIGIVATATLPTVAKYLVQKINKWIEAKTGIDSATEEVKEIATDAKELEKKLESDSISTTGKDVDETKGMIRKIENLQKTTQEDVISSTDFRNWALQSFREEQLTGEEIVNVTIYQLELLLEKLNRGPTERITDIQNVIVALKTNLKFLLRREKAYGLSGLNTDEEKVMQSQRTLEKSLLEARSIIEKYE